MSVYEKMKTICVFNMKKSNVEFVKLIDILSTNRPILSFNDDLEEITRAVDDYLQV